MFDPAKAEHVYIAMGYTNFRLGIDGLTELIAVNFGRNPQCNSLFLFCGRRRDRIKGIFWDGDGYILLYKRLEKGRYKWPGNINELKELTPRQFRWLLDGLNIIQPDAIQPIQEIFDH